MIPFRHNSGRRGIALLLVLATLMLATSTIVALARVATDTRLATASLRDQRLAGQLLDASEAPIADWLHRHAGRLSLPPDATSPRFTVLDDTLELAGEPVRITITAFDQCGMPSTTARSASTDQHVPFLAIEVIGRLGESYDAHPGLDLLAAGTTVQVFPSADGWGPSLGEQAATHNPPRPGGRAVLNINTAPIALIESVYAARGLGGIDAITAARANGRVASPGAIRAPDSTENDKTPIPVSMSTAWAFRVDCRVGTVSSSWWSVYADTGNNWERVQHLAIAE